jgi:diguanylate cyclase (GGDEF)-like protein/PAS domain S-box-containing protein
MAQLVEFSLDPPASDPLAISRGSLPKQLDHLLLTVPSISALYSLLSKFLLEVVELDGVWLGSLDEQEQVTCHFSAGEGVAEFLSTGTIALDENLDSPVARAWRTNIPQFVLDWADDQEHLPCAYWRERGLHFGWRSSCAIPVSGAAGKRDVLVLYSKRPRFFGKGYIWQFVLQLHSLLGFALERLRLLDAITKDQQTLTLYKTALDASVNGILVTEAAGDFPIRYVNPAFEHMTGYRSEEILGKNCRFLQGTDTSQPQLKIVHEAVRQGKSCTVELRNYRKDGTMFWNSLSIAPVLNQEGIATHFIGIQKDVTEIKTILNKSVHSNSLYRALMSTAELVVRARTERELLATLCHLLVESKLFTKVWIGRPNAAGDLEIQSICGNSGDVEDLSGLPNVLTGDEKSILAVRAWRRCQIQFTHDRLMDPEGLPVQNRDQTHQLLAAAVVPLYRDGEIWGLLTLHSQESNIFNDELLELIERIGRLAGYGLDGLDLRHTLEEERRYQSWLARHDPVTDLLNRRGLTEQVEEAMARAQRRGGSMAVALVDLNGFRALNELHGHTACDQMLRTVADRLQKSLRPGDTAGRLGGDEFVLVLEDVDEKKLAKILPRIQAAVEGPIDLSNGRKATIQTSIGVTVFPQDNSTARHLLRHADRALYAMKGDKVAPVSRWMRFQPEADEQRRIRREYILELFHKGNVRVHYQPLVNLQTGALRGVEALARLVDSNGEIIRPADFLPHLGPVELAALTSQLLSRGLLDIHRMDAAGFRLNLGINLEPAILADSKAMQELRHTIDTSSMGPHRVVLELLEHHDTLSMTVSREVLLDLKSSGVRIALDDVGSAYSSLLRLKELPVDGLKLDRSLLNGLDRRPKEMRLLMHLVDLAETLGVDLIVEGIESSACRDAIAAAGVRLAQGYAIAMPMNIHELELWLLKYKPVPWTGPTSPLGAVALQLRDLFITGRILDQKAALVEKMICFNPDCHCQIGLAFQRIGVSAEKLYSAHVGWHQAMSALWDRSAGSIDFGAFQAARASYEEDLFQLVLEAQACEVESLHSF